MTSVPCCVCGVALAPSAAHFANAWESSLGTHPCCSKACAGRFDPTSHWLPTTAPKQLSDAEADVFVRNARRRLAAAEDPKLVARDLLLAGVVPWQVRRILGGEAIAEDSVRRFVAGPNLMGRIFGALSGSALVTVTPGRGKADIKDVVGAGSEVDAWLARFPAEPEQA